MSERDIQRIEQAKRTHSDDWDIVSKWEKEAESEEARNELQYWRVRLYHTAERECI